jgi:hypothetical protein
MLPLRDNVPTRSFPVVTVALIAINAAVWIWELAGTPWQQDVFEYGYYVCSFNGPCTPDAGSPLSWPLALFSSMFMHAGWEHILGNMLFLWIFGNNVEDVLGRVRFVVFYLLGGIAADALQTAVTLGYGNTADASIPNIGASGAISAVLGAYIVLLPRASVLTWVFYVIREIRAFWFLGIWFALQLFLGSQSIAHPEAGGGVAFFAHVGGFAFGMALVRVFAVREPLDPAY